MEELRGYDEWKTRSPWDEPLSPQPEADDDGPWEERVTYRVTYHSSSKGEQQIDKMADGHLQNARNKLRAKRDGEDGLSEREEEVLSCLEEECDVRDERERRGEPRVIQFDEEAT